MKHILRGAALLLIFVCGSLSAQPNLGVERTRYNTLRVSRLDSLRVGGEQGVAAAFAGVCNGRAIVAGGCNFPDVPAKDGGAKVFYDKVFALDYSLGRARWKEVGKLPKPLAYGAAVGVSDGIVCIGGTSDGKTSSRDVFLLSFEGSNVSYKALSALPVGLDQMAAALVGDCVYVAAGQTDGAASQRAFRLKYPTATAWEVLPDLPDGVGRLQPCGVAQNAATEQRFWLFGGFDPATKRTAVGGLSFSPLANAWTTTSPMIVEGDTLALVGAAATASGCGHVLFFGGVNRSVFEQALQSPAADYLAHPKEWYAFAQELLIYQTITDAWTRQFADSLFARAGAALIPTGPRTWLLIDGEEKPGVRSAAVSDVEMGYEASFGVLNWAVLIAYLVAMLLLGAYFMRRQKSGDDFFKGGGRIPWWAAGISIFATMLSAITYMSIPAKAYATNWTYYPMQICILLVSFPVIKYYLPFFRRLNVSTAYEYLERRFSYAVRALASVLFIVFMVARMALVLYLPSLAMEAVTGIDISLCIVLMALITIVYCTMGGVEAVVWGDVVQGFILVGGAVLAAVYLVLHTGEGASDFFTIASANDKFRLFEWSFDWRTATFWVVIIGGLANNLISYTSDQTVIQRYLTTKDERSAARGILTNGLLSVVVTIAFFTIGTGLYTFFKTHPAEMDFTMAKTDAIFPFFLMSHLPKGVAGLLIAAIFAATMSTISSNINSVSTAYTMDFYRKRRPSADDRSLLRVARWVGIIAGGIGMGVALLMARFDIQSLLDYFNTLLGLLSGGVGALFLMGIFFPRIGDRAALIGFVAGTLVVFLLNFYTSVNFLLFGAVSIVVSLLVALIVAQFEPKTEPKDGLTWKTLR